MKMIKKAILGTLLGAGCMVSGPVLAQVDSRTTTVLERSRPELDALGVRQGGFLLFPSFDVESSYDDNIFSTDTGTQDDVIVTATPALRIDSDWNQHFLQFRGSADIVRHMDNDAEDHNDVSLGVNGRLDIQRDTAATAGVSYSKAAEERGSADDVNGTEPTEYTVAGLDAGVSNKWNRVSAKVDFGFRERDFDDVPTSAGTTVNNDDRDRKEYKLTVRGGYEIQPEYEAFAEVIYNSINYNDNVDDSGLNRDNEGFEVRAGARVDLTGLLFGDIYVGYITRDYEAASLKSANAPTAGVDLTWNASPLTTVKGGVAREISETTLVSSSGVFSTRITTSVDHELLRNLIVSGRLGVSRDEYEGSSREDDYIRAGLTGKFMLNRNLYLSLQYDYATRESNAAAADYEKNTVFLRIRAQM